MKNKVLLASLLVLMATIGSAESTWKEMRTVLRGPEQSLKGLVLQPGEKVTEIVNFQLKDLPARRMLRVTGGIKMPVPFANRGETLFRKAEYLIDDNLDSTVTKRERYSLYFKGNNDVFERLAYQRIPGHLLKPGELVVTIPVVKKIGLDVDECQHGNFGLKIGLYFQMEGRNELDIYDQPDSVLYLPVPEGNSHAQQISKTFILPPKVACAILQLGGTHFKGECWVEAPRFQQKHRNVCSLSFTKFDERTDSINYWVGTNLSTRSWPMWRLQADGKTIFEGNIFDRASNVADFYIQLPKNLNNPSELTLQLVKESHRATFPYEIRSLEIIEETARDFEVISVPRYVAKKSAFGVLVETNEPDVTLCITGQGAVMPSAQICHFKKPGLHVVEMRAAEAGASIELSFQRKGDQTGRKEVAFVQQVIDKEAENIYVSSGDEIYIDKVYGAYDYFFKWYMANRVGNWYQFRPSYQWSGFRVENDEVIHHYTDLLNQLKVPYAWQVEGRTLASSKINPSADVLASPMFRGKQAHENDGGYYYWTHFKYEGLFSDLSARARPYGGIFAKHRPIYTDHGTFIHYDTSGLASMAEGARMFVNNLSYSKGESTRHTGPSSLFRYFYQAGYNWLGAEQMYGPEETILSSLRGASRAYRKNDFGTLHAMQWGSGPFTDPKHSLRLYMSLAVAYMHGSSHMNTEEALWTDERMNDRYSQSGKEHLFAQHQVLDFVETHTRRGELKSNIAVIQGRNDAWKSFVRGNLWSQTSEQWKFDKANESFDLLRVFYPQNLLDACGPHGWFTATPYGTVDLLPIEASLEVMNRYQALIFLGWNTYDESDFARIREFVFQGGTVLLSAAHLNAAPLPNTPTCFPKDDQGIRNLLGKDYHEWTEKRTIQFGAGKIIYFPQAAYPSEAVIMKDYEKAMREIAQLTVNDELKKGWIIENPSVGFTVWNKGERRTIYLLNTDWKSSEKSQSATLAYGAYTFSVQVRRYHIETVHCMDGLALHPLANTTDIIGMERVEQGWKVKIQTTGKDRIQCMQSKNGSSHMISITKAGISELFIKED